MNDKFSSSYPILLLCLIIPMLVFVLLFLKKLADKKTALIALVSTLISFVIWIVFRSSVKKIAEKNQFIFETTGWYVMDLICMLIIVFFSALVALKKMELDMDLLLIFSGQNVRYPEEQIHEIIKSEKKSESKYAGFAVPDIKENIQHADVKRAKFCRYCGVKLKEDAIFCPHCGVKIKSGVSESLQDTSDTGKNETEV